MSEEMNDYKEFLQKMHQKICGYQEAIGKGVKVSILEVIKELRADIEQYEAAHPKDNQ